jgi:hypothetical protein
VAQRLGVTERQMQRLVLRAIATCHARLAITELSDKSAASEGDNDAPLG